MRRFIILALALSLVAGSAMTQIDPASNFGNAPVSTGYDAAATSITLSTGYGARFPIPAAGTGYNLIWWDFTGFPNPSSPGSDAEIVRVTARSGDVLTIVRAQEGTSAVTHNTAGRTYRVSLGITAKTIDDIRAEIARAARDSVLAHALGNNLGTDELVYAVTPESLATVAGVSSAEAGCLDGVTSAIQTQINSKGPNTGSFVWAVLDTVKTGGETLPGWKVPYGITITEVAAYCDANTVTFNLEERGETTPNTSGTAVMTSSLVADTDQQETTTFTNAGIAQNAWLVPVVSTAGDVTIFSITIRFTIP